MQSVPHRRESQKRTGMKMFLCMILNIQCQHLFDERGLYMVRKYNNFKDEFRNGKEGKLQAHNCCVSGRFMGRNMSYSYSVIKYSHTR